jgi:hypothetical protein
MPSFERRGKTIGAAVGRGGANVPSDVNTVKFLLNNVPQSQGGPFSPLSTGTSLDSLAEAIEGFQDLQFGQADGRVDPGGRTIRLLGNFDPTPDSPAFVPGLASGKKASGKKAGTPSPGLVIPTDPFTPRPKGGGSKGGGSKGSR